MIADKFLSRVISGAALAITLSFQNCSPARFSSQSAETSPSAAGGCSEGTCLADNPASQFVNIDVSGTILQPGTSCAPALDSTQLGIRTLFVIDRSGSNESYGGVGTDPGKVYRSATLNEFFNRYRAKSNFWWGLNAFDTASRAFVNGGSKTIPKITNDANVMSSAISAFIALNDGSGTNYKSALDMVSAQIAGDTARDSNTRYVIVFVSDGMPDEGYEYSHGQLTVAGMDTMLKDVQTIVSSMPGKITLNAIYYGPNDKNAASVMRKMAAVGMGRFLDVNVDGKSFPIADVVQVPGLICR